MNGPWQKEMGARARQRRKELAMTQAELALLAGCNTVFISELEQGKPTLRLDKVLDVLEALGLRLEVAG